MKNPNAPLMAPDLVSGRVQVANGHDTVDNNGGGDYNSSALKSSDFKSINSRDHSHSTSSAKSLNLPPSLGWSVERFYQSCDGLPGQ